MSRVDGRKIVGIAFTAIVGAVGLGQIYLPYIADRDKIRGLFEEDDMPIQARQEMDMIMKEQRMASQAAKLQKEQSGGNDRRDSKQSDTNAGSMWSNLRRGQQN